MASLLLTAIQEDPVLHALLLKFAAAEACWFGSTRPDGRAHLAPIWHVVHAHRVYVVTQQAAVRAQNIQLHPAVSLALPDPMNALILEGVARPANQLRATVQPLFSAKYNWDIGTDPAYDVVLGVTPRKIIAWGTHGEGRWTITDPAPQAMG